MGKTERCAIPTFRTLDRIVSRAVSRPCGNAFCRSWRLGRCKQESGRKDQKEPLSIGLHLWVSAYRVVMHICYRRAERLDRQKPRDKDLRISSSARVSRSIGTPILSSRRLFDTSYLSSSSSPCCILSPYCYHGSLIRLRGEQGAAW